MSAPAAAPAAAAAPKKGGKKVEVEEVVDGIEHGDPEANGSPFPLDVLVMPATVAHVKAISEHWERMPAKSTYFYPKLLSGLVINSLE